MFCAKAGVAISVSERGKGEEGKRDFFGFLSFIFHYLELKYTRMCASKHHIVIIIIIKYCHCESFLFFGGGAFARCCSSHSSFVSPGKACGQYLTP